LGVGRVVGQEVEVKLAVRKLEFLDQGQAQELIKLDLNSRRQQVSEYIH
jgi:hypothetical protein